MTFCSPICAGTGICNKLYIGIIYPFCLFCFQDNIPDSTLKKLKKYIDNPKFTPENVEKVSKVC